MNWTEQEYEDYKKKHGLKPQIGVNLVPAEKKKSKYNATREKVDGIFFDSKKEADTYRDLKMLLKAGEISGFCRQPEFILQEGFAEVKPITYRADWIIFYKNGSYDIRDDKGIETEVFKLKHKMFREKFPDLELKVVKGA